MADLQEKPHQTRMNVPWNVQEGQQVRQKVSKEEGRIPHQALNVQRKSAEH